MTTIRVERVYQHPRAKVWRALTEPELLARWLMPNDFKPVVGHRFEFRTEPGPGFDGIVRCQVREIDEPKRLVFTWAGGPIDTVVTFTLEETADGTRLIVEQTGFSGPKAWIVSRILKIGSRTIYGRRLPDVLNEMEGGGEPTQENACMTPQQGLLRRLLTLLTH